MPYNAYMFSTKFFVRSVPLALSVILILALTSFFSRSIYAVNIPFVGEVSIGTPNLEENPIRADVLFGYRPSPQTYSLSDTVEFRTLVVNNSPDPHANTFELKVYKVTELWNSTMHGISYDQRTAYINGQPDSEIKAVSEDTLRTMYYDTKDCALIAEEFCYQTSNPEDGDYPYGGVVLGTKPIYVHITDEIALAPNERTNLKLSWQPQNCGYYRVVVQPFGYQEELGEENQTRDAFVRVKGCEEGQILDGVSTSKGGTTLGEHMVNGLPATSSGIVMYLLPAVGLLIGGIMIHRGMKGILSK